MVYEVQVLIDDRELTKTASKHTDLKKETVLQDPSDREWKNFEMKNNLLYQSRLKRCMASARKMDSWHHSGCCYLKISTMCQCTNHTTYGAICSENLVAIKFLLYFGQYLVAILYLIMDGVFC